ncbi:hypothetical protein HK096_001957 [Nowakowskiella sp. JEL0078]|nr:hypothetical protein HK096_001957 [Nowakowskiella sp. JEL0078]
MSRKARTLQNAKRAGKVRAFPPPLLTQPQQKVFVRERVQQPPGVGKAQGKRGEARVAQRPNERRTADRPLADQQPDPRLRLAFQTADSGGTVRRGADAAAAAEDGRGSQADRRRLSVLPRSQQGSGRHMSKAHSFFVPNLEFLTDLPGLLSYLQEKVAVANICLYCNGKGRSMHSLEAVRKHMIDKGHCKFADEADDEEDEDEYADFYDYESSWEDVSESGIEEDESWVEVDTSSSAPGTSISKYTNSSTINVVDDQVELELPSGARIGHRSYNRYWKQYLPATRTQKNKDVVKSLLIQYRLLGHTTPQMQVAERKEKHKQAKMISIRKREEGMRVGQKGNMFLMKFYRRQNPI